MEIKMEIVKMSDVSNSQRIKDNLLYSYSLAFQDFNFATGKYIDLAIVKMTKIESRFKELFGEEISYKNIA